MSNYFKILERLIPLTRLDACTLENLAALKSIIEDMQHNSSLYPISEIDRIFYIDGLERSMNCISEIKKKLSTGEEPSARSKFKDLVHYLADLLK